MNIKIKVPPMDTLREKKEPTLADKRKGKWVSIDLYSFTCLMYGMAICVKR